MTSPPTSTAPTRTVALKEKLKIGQKRNNRVVSAKARCPRGQVSIAGGFDGTNTEDQQTFIFESRRKGARSWEAAAGAYSESGRVKWKTFAYCVAKAAVD